VARRLGDLLRRRGRSAGLLFGLIAMLIYLWIVAPIYISQDNFKAVAFQVSFLGTMAMGTSLLIISGNVDLSIGSMFTVSALAAAMSSKVVAPPLAMGFGVLVAAFIGSVNGLLVWRMRISPIIITLGSLTLLQGLAQLISGGYGILGVPASFATFGQSDPFTVPMPVWVFLGVAIIAYVVLHQTTIGRHIYAIGGNREASTAAGIGVRRLTIGLFAVNGIIVGIAAVVAASRLGTADPQFGVGYEFQVITAVILGGVAFTGGEGSIGGVILAVALLGVIQSGLITIGLDPSYTDIVTGAALIIAVSLDQLASEQRERYRRLLAMRGHRIEVAPAVGGAAGRAAGRLETEQKDEDHAKV
jgi:ribose/xylose/arabinose/galactoside ABC-type transport system permease subunit